MEVLPVRTEVLRPPRDNLRAVVVRAGIELREGDCIAITSKVVSIDEGRCVPIDPGDPLQRDTLAKQEAAYYLERGPGEHTLHTVTRRFLIGGAGIDRSNGDGYLILWPKDPHASAAALHAWFCEQYRVHDLALIITDYHSTPLRRGALGCAIGWAGFDPLVDHRGEMDLFGRSFQVEHTNLADALAASAVLVMGETNACTPLALIRGAPPLPRAGGGQHEVPYEVPIEDDLYAPFLTRAPWQRGGGAA